jgi:hypothetical protein
MVLLYPGSRAGLDLNRRRSRVSSLYLADLVVCLCRPPGLQRR